LNPQEKAASVMLGCIGERACGADLKKPLRANKF